MSVLLVFFNITTVTAIGLTLTIALGLVGQIIASSVVDHYGLFTLEKRRWNMKKLSGFALIAAGIAVMAWPKA
jgi:transporter family-2 protein